MQKTPELQEILQDSSYLEELATQCEEMSSASLVKILNEASYEFLVNNVPFKTAALNAIESYNEKEIDDILAKKHICSKKHLELDKDSTIKYDTNFLRYIYDDNDVKDFTGIGGRKKVKDALQRMLIRMWKPEVIARMKANHMAMPSGIILHGTSGNGKTTIVKALAGEMKLPLYEMKMGDVGSSYIHQTSNLIGEMFDQLAYKYKKTKEPSILFIDELESIAPRREALTANSQYKQEEITELLRRMNTASENGIILVGATNFIDMVDTAVRSNRQRMGNLIEIDNPDIETITDIISKTFADKPAVQNLNNEKTINKLALKCLNNKNQIHLLQRNKKKSKTCGQQ